VDEFICDMEANTMKTKIITSGVSRYAKKRRQKMKSKLYVVGLALILSALIVSGCGPTTVEPAESPMAAPTEQPTEVPTITPTETTVEVSPTEPPTRTPLPPAGGLSPAGPWLVYLDQEGLAAVNADGGGYALLLMIELPTGQTRQVVEEAFPPTPPGEWAGGMPWGWLRAVTFGSWSADGGSALIVSAHQGSAELYRYEVASGVLAPISDGPAIAYRPGLSPDGRYIVWEEIESFGTGAGLSVAGLWAVPADGSSSPTLLAGSEIGEGYKFLGWRNDTEFAFTVWHGLCGAGGAWIANVETGQVQAVMDTLNRENWECVMSVAYSPLQDDFLFLVGDLNLEGATLTPGLHRLGLDGSTEFLTSLADDTSRVLWSEAVDSYLLPTRGSNEFRLYPFGVAQGRPYGDVPSEPFQGQAESLTRSPDGNWLAVTFSEEGVGHLLVGPSLEALGEVYQGSEIEESLWAPDSAALFVMAGGQLLCVDRDTGSAAVVDEAIAESSSMQWVYP
jgi:hypothetical protein